MELISKECHSIQKSLYDKEKKPSTRSSWDEQNTWISSSWGWIQSWDEFSARLVMQSSENEEDLVSESTKLWLWAWEMEFMNSVRSDDTVFLIDNAEWFVSMFSSNIDRQGSVDGSMIFVDWRSQSENSCNGVAKATTRRLFSVIVPVLSERICLNMSEGNRN